MEIALFGECVQTTEVLSGKNLLYGIPVSMPKDVVFSITNSFGSTLLFPHINLKERGVYMFKFRDFDKGCFK